MKWVLPSVPRSDDVGRIRPKRSLRMTLSIIPVHGIPEVRPRDDLVGLLLIALGSAGDKLVDGDVLVVAQKVVSKSEGRLVRLGDVVPGKRALEMAEESGKDARQLEVVLGESKQIVRWIDATHAREERAKAIIQETARVVARRGEIVIAQTRHGFVCANAGVDRSNAGAPDTVVLLPLDPDASAARLRDELAKRAHATVAVVITDTFGRAWREGHTNVAIGIAGLPALKRYIGQRDPEGYELRVTEIAVADEIAAAAELVMGKLDRCPVAIVRGLTFEDSDETAQEYVRPAERDMFR